MEDEGRGLRPEAGDGSAVKECKREEGSGGWGEMSWPLRPWACTHLTRGEGDQEGAREAPALKG